MASQIETITIAAGLSGLAANVNQINLCSSEPTTYAAAASALATFSPGAGNVFGAPAALSAPNVGLGVTSVSVVATILTSGTANWWAAVDSINEVLYAHAGLGAAPLTEGGSFTVPNLLSIGLVV